MHFIRITLCQKTIRQLGNIEIFDLETKTLRDCFAMKMNWCIDLSELLLNASEKKSIPWRHRRMRLLFH